MTQARWSAFSAATSSPPRTRPAPRCRASSHARVHQHGRRHRHGLDFSRCTEQRWTWDIPYIQPSAGGSYWVSGPLRSQTVGPAETVGEAVAMVLERLPVGCGPAFLGTPEELAAHEAMQAQLNG
ncbi:DUF6193 family natural product biosynthesis protein [Streptomyces sp. WZ.A104]|uniref:DUF6193 family natural product biosynthesis protein n=1 Tax=Streptomyces sp. WZ.A104 TaxID=2023771 RepID=UPI00211BC0E6|nr:DUF6193 family natural product biosynthesis protein [Streptomyces sp. WZ.A104]